MDKMKQLLEAQQIKPTPLRLDIIRLLNKAKTPISAYELLERLQKTRPNAKAMTVYRTLHTFEQALLVHKIEKNNAYILCCHPNHQDHCQIISCCKCDHYIELHDKQLFNQINTAIKQNNFSPSDQLFQIHAVCHNCK